MAEALFAVEARSAAGEGVLPLSVAMPLLGRWSIEWNTAVSNDAADPVDVVDDGGGSAVAVRLLFVEGLHTNTTLLLGATRSRRLHGRNDEGEQQPLPPAPQPAAVPSPANSPSSPMRGIVTGTAGDG